MSVVASHSALVSNVAIIEHSSDMLNLSVGEFLINLMFGSQRWREYAPRILEEYRSVCRKTPGLKGSSSPRCKRGQSQIGGFSHNIGFGFPWQQHFKKFDILHVQFAGIINKLKLVKKKLLRQLPRQLEWSDSGVVASPCGIGIVEPPKKLLERWVIQRIRSVTITPARSHRMSLAVSRKRRMENVWVRN